MKAWNAFFFMVDHTYFCKFHPVNAKTFRLLPYWEWVRLYFADIKYDNTLAVYYSEMCLVSHGHQTGKFPGDCMSLWNISW